MNPYNPHFVLQGEDLVNRGFEQWKQKFLGSYERATHGGEFGEDLRKQF